MLTVTAKGTHAFSLRDAPLQTNLSYTGTFYELQPGDWVKIQARLDSKPDQVRMLQKRELRSAGGALVSESVDCGKETNCIGFRRTIT